VSQFDEVGTEPVPSGQRHGWLLVLTLVNLILANAIVSFVVAMG
jgi:hypothetical protein